MRDAADLDFLSLQEALAGRYSLQRELGRGGMGIVYLAREVRLDRPVALKLLPPQYAAQPALRERFLREARTAARLSHPNIVPIHAVDEVGDFVFIVMAYIEGQTLEQRMRERGPVPAKETARILREVAWALAYAHAQGVVHRDVKPGNILLEAGSGRALVSDFGIAHVSDGAVLTGSNDIMGTAEYMSPEQASGEVIDGRSDIYALGVVGFQMLSGQLPIEGPTVAATLAKQITQAAAPLATVAPELPGNLTEAIDRCLAKNPAARFEDGEQLAEVIGRALEQRRDIPLPLRMFIERVQHAARGLVGLCVMSTFSLTFLGIFGLGLLEAPPGMAALQAIMAALFGSTAAGILLKMVRGLLRSGYDHDQLLRALRSELEDRRDALGTDPQHRSFLDRVMYALGIGGFAINIAVILILFFGSYFPAFETVVGPIWVLGTFGLVGGGLWTATRKVLSERVTGDRALKFWDSRIGRALFKVAGLKLDRSQGGGDAYRPTELAISMAADRLFEQLPAPLQQSLAELPAVVRSLESHAESIRARMAELDGIMRDVGANERGRLASVQNIAQQRQSLAADMHAARTAAEERLAEVVAALETIRLQLLRMHAGVGSVERMTADLSAARDIAQNAEHLVEGGKQVDDVLGIVRPRARGDTPVPV